LASRLSASKHIYVNFHFASPTGKALYGKQVYSWPDQRELPVPKRGTPIKILYARDDAYLLL
jgi:hypothetical protein